MATNLKISNELLDEALKLGGFATKRDTVTSALEEFVSRRKQLAVLELRGKIDFDPTFDYKEQRQRP